MSTPLNLRSVITPFENVPRDGWEKIWPSEDEKYEHYLAESQAGIKGVEFLCLQVYQGDQMVGVLPLFIMDFNMQLSVTGIARNVLTAIQRWWPRFLVFKTLFGGTMLGESFCLGIHPGMAGNPEIYSEIDRALVALARERKASMIVLKDISSSMQETVKPMARFGYSQSEALAMAYIPINFRSLDEYIASLSSAKMRKNLRQKIKKSASLGGITVEETRNIDAVINQVIALFQNISDEKEDHFVDLTKEYFSNFAKMVPQTIFFLYWTGEGSQRKLIGFNMCSDLSDRLFDRFIGLDYEASYDHSLYFIHFLENIRWCIEHKKKEYTLSIGGYEVKKRLGALMRPMTHWTKILNPFINQMAMLTQKRN